MKRFIYISAAFLLAAVFSGCSGRDVAGDVTETGTAVAGIIQNPSGKPAEGVEVKVFGRTFNPLSAESLPEGQVDTTDSQGRYRILLKHENSESDSVIVREYTLEALHLQKGTRYINTELEVEHHANLVEPEVAVLAAAANVEVPLPMHFKEGSFVYIPHTSIYVRLSGSDLEKGSVLFPSVPQGEFLPVVFSNDAYHSDSYPVTESFSVVPNEALVLENVPGLMPGWRYSGKIFINTAPGGADVSESQFGVPVPVRLNSSNFDFSQAMPGGEDIRFRSASGKALEYQIEEWNPADMSAALWVRADTIFGHNGDQFIRVFWGNSSAASGSGAGVFSAASGYAGVWHLSGSPADSAPGAVRDASEAGRHGTASGGMSDSSLVTGIIGKALHFDGADDQIHLGNFEPLGSSLNGLTLSAWIRPDFDTSTVKHNSILCFADTLLDADLRFRYNRNLHDWRIGVRTSQGEIYTADTQNRFILPWHAGEWHFLAGTYDNGLFKIYWDGDSSFVNEAPDGIEPGSYILTMGNWHPGLLTERNIEHWFHGALDEVRISLTPRSSAWVKLDFEMQRAGSGTVTFSRN